ncbi:hypothetical protein G6F56_008522 [Rhizopus delemar]|nr:hypothetical protein G6F56_008522 [Rhizopus delemar]
MPYRDYNPYSSLDDDIEDESNFYNDRYGEDDSVYSYDAEAEWEERKWLGKKLSFWVWAKYMNRVPLSSRYGTIKQLTI